VLAQEIKLFFTAKRKTVHTIKITNFTVLIALKKVNTIINKQVLLKKMINCIKTGVV
jgi:hypothetical protein